MAVQQINKVTTAQPIAKATLEITPERARRLELYTQETWQRHANTQFVDLRSAQMSLATDDRQAVSGYFAAAASDTDRQRRLSASVELAQALSSSGAVGPTGEMSSGLRAATSTAIATHLLTGGATEMSRISEGFTAMAIGGMETELARFSHGMQENLIITDELRTTATELRDMLSTWPEGSAQNFSWNEVTFDDKGRASVTHHEAKLTKEEATALLDKLQTQLSTAGDMNEMVKFDLQKLYQDYQQGVQTIAAIQKDIHDNIMRVLNNIKS